MRQLTASQKIARLEYRIAKLEKKAFIGILTKKVKGLIQWISNNIQIVLIGTNMQRIEKEIKRLQKNEKFMKVVRNAPPRSTFRQIWGYMFVYLKRIPRMVLDYNLLVFVGCVMAIYFSFTPYAIAKLSKVVIYILRYAIPMLALNSNMGRSGLIDAKPYRKDLAKQIMLNRKNPSSQLP